MGDLNKRSSNDQFQILSLHGNRYNSKIIEHVFRVAITFDGLESFFSWLIRFQFNHSFNLQLRLLTTHLPIIWAYYTIIHQRMSIQQSKLLNNNAKIGVIGEVHARQSSPRPSAVKASRWVAIGDTHVRVFSSPLFSSGRLGRWTVELRKTPTQARHAMPPARVHANFTHLPIPPNIHARFFIYITF